MVIGDVRRTESLRITTRWQTTMLNANQAKWTAAVSDKTTIDDQTSSSTLMSDDSNNRKSRDCPEVEALKQVYEQICAIRHSHAQIVAENSAKRAEVSHIIQHCFLYYSFLFSHQLIVFARYRTSYCEMLSRNHKRSVEMYHAQYTWSDGGHRWANF